MTRFPWYYVCGPMTGRDAANRPAFEAARVRLLDDVPLGRVTIPHDLVRPHTTEAQAMRQCCDFICDRADDSKLTVVALSDWRESEGAVIEVRLALRLAVPVHEIDGAQLCRLAICRDEFTKPGGQVERVR